LQALGFSELEAHIYCFLLTESPATGYRISHAIGKPTANTYKAITALAQRGAIVMDDGESRLARASGDSRVYQLADTDQALQRARALLARASHVVLIDAFPGPLAALWRRSGARQGQGHRRLCQDLCADRRPRRRGRAG
jgi:predicted transcriptional regulator